MPNGYAVVPNILPGNVTVGGNLTIAGDQLQIGATSPFVRLGKPNVAGMLLSHNVQFDAASKDVNTSFAFALTHDSTQPQLIFRRSNAAAGVVIQTPPTAIFTDYTAHDHTGTVTVDTIYSKIIRGGLLGANGGLRWRCMMSTVAQGATNTVVSFNLGATLIVNWPFTALQDLAFDVYLANTGALNAQWRHGLTINMSTGAQNPNSGAHAVDTSVDQTFSVTVQNGAATDHQVFRFLAVELINSFGPV